MSNYQRLLILCIPVLSTYAAPLQLQYQSQFSVQPTQEELLQQQLFALQQLQNLQMTNDWNNYYQSIVTQNRARPMMILLPESQVKVLMQTNNELNSANTFLKRNDGVKDKETENEDLDSVIIEAEPQLELKPEPEPKKAILLIPSMGRISIGDVISAIPFLPIEINVPDTISWIGNGISSIISGIGNRFPIWRPTQVPTEENNNVRLLIKRLQNRNNNIPAPILMLPDVAQVYPMPIPVQF